MMNKFLDYASGMYFMADYIKVRQALNNLECRNTKGEAISWSEYYTLLNLPTPMFLPRLLIGQPMHGYQFRFDLRPSNDEDCVIIFIDAGEWS